MAFVAGAADHEGLAPPHRHQPDPGRFLPPPWFVEVGEVADVVDFHVVRRPAHLAPARDEPADQLVAAGGAQGRRPVDEGCCGLPVQRDSAELTTPLYSTWYFDTTV
jgi:hypothetical protein